MSLQVTSAAAQELRAAAVRSGAEGLALRVAARPSGDGLSYALGFDQPGHGDFVMQVDGLVVVVGADSQPLLAGTVLDYVELDAGQRDFIFVPPRSTGGCGSRAAGCGGGGGACGSCA